jgi:hypothetical protein
MPVPPRRSFTRASTHVRPALVPWVHGPHHIPCGTGHRLGPGLRLHQILISVNPGFALSTTQACSGGIPGAGPGRKPAEVRRARRRGSLSRSPSGSPLRVPEQQRQGKQHGCGPNALGEVAAVSPGATVGAVAVFAYGVFALSTRENVRSTGGHRHRTAGRSERVLPGLRRGGVPRAVSDHSSVPPVKSAAKGGRA